MKHLIFNMLILKKSGKYDKKNAKFSELTVQSESEKQLKIEFNNDSSRKLQKY